MKRVSLFLFVITMITVSCSKDKDNKTDPDPATTSSFTMTYDGITYTEAEANSLSLVGGNIAVAGTTGDGYLLTIGGIGADGTTTNICTDPDACDHLCTLMLDFGAAVGMEGYLATSGTVKRNGNTLEIDVLGLGITNYETKPLTATIVVGSVLDF